jgi:hypothetical protein
MERLEFLSTLPELRRPLIRQQPFGPPAQILTIRLPD